MNGYPITIKSDSLLDAFGRMRVSTPFTLFDSFHQYQDNGKLTEYTSGTAYSTHDANSSSVVLTVGGNAGDKVFRESSKIFAYQPGKSLLIMQTFCMSPGKPGLRQRHGYFDSKNGVFLQQQDSTLSFVRRSSVSGTVKETIVPQSEWNSNRMPELDITRVQILFIDIEWLGVGTVRVGFVVNGEYIVCHKFHHANKQAYVNVDTTLPYMATACLPVRVELENVSATGSQSIYRVICTTVMSEGGYELRGRQRSIGTQLDVPRVLAQANVFYPLMSIRLKQANLNAIVVPVRVNIHAVSSSDYSYKIIINPTITDGSWVSAGASSYVEYNITSSTAISSGNGTDIHMGFFTSSSQGRTQVDLTNSNFKYQLERNTFTSTAYAFTVAVATKDTNRHVYVSIDWEEIN